MNASQAATPSGPKPEKAPKKRAGTLETAIVLISMLILSATAGVAAHLHAGLDTVLSIICALTVFCVLISVHLISNFKPAKGHQKRAKSAPSKSHRAAKQTSTDAAPAEAPAAKVNEASEQSGSKPISESESPANNHLSDRLAEALQTTDEDKASHPQTADADTSIAPAAEPRAASADNEVDANIIDTTKELAAWNFRPGSLRTEPAGLKSLPSIPPADAPSPEPSPPESSHDSPPQSETLENGDPKEITSPVVQPNIEGILKRMAAQINAGMRTDNAQPQTDDDTVLQSTDGPTSDGDERAAIPAATPEDSAAGVEDPRKAISEAVDALRAAADEMRNQQDDENPAVTNAEPESKDTDEPEDSEFSAPIHTRLSEVAEAIARDQLDIYLDPIIGLEDGRPRHFEVAVKVRTKSGDEFDPDDFRDLTRGSGLMPFLDATRVRHSAAIASRLTSRVENSSIFSELDSETLDSNRFFATVTRDQQAGHLQTSQLVLSFRQSDVRAFAQAHFKSLKLLRDMGFRFSVQDITDLDMNFEELTDAGFEYGQTRCRSLLEGYARRHRDLALNGSLPAS